MAEMARLEPQEGSQQPRQRASGPAAESEAVAGAVSDFLAGRPLRVGYAEIQVGGYRALCGAPAGGAAPGNPPLLLATEDGAAYVLHRPDWADGELVEAALRANRYRPAGGTLALRLPADCGGGTGVFRLWASPKYLAGASQAEPLWK